MLLRIYPFRRRGLVTILLSFTALFLLVAFFCHAPGSSDHDLPLLSWASTSGYPICNYEISSSPSACSRRLPVTTNQPSTGFAIALSPQELLCRPLNISSIEIPKLFHQSWKSGELPAKFKRWSNSCRTKHPNWEWVLWTDEDNYHLVHTYFPWLEETYAALPGPIYKADFARNLYMYMFGGVYADLDTECLHSTTEALKSYRIPVLDETNATFHDEVLEEHRPIALFGRMGSDWTFEHSIPNAWMAASPRHPFFLLPLQSAKAGIRNSRHMLHRLWHGFPSAEYLTGPVALRESILRWKLLAEVVQEVVLLPANLVYPFDWQKSELRAVCSATEDTFSEQLCKETLEVKQKASMAITYWSHTHSGTGSNARNIEQISH